MTGLLTHFTRDGLTFDVIDQGPRDGEIVILLHGWPQLNTCWGGVMTHLNAVGYRTIAPNQRGFALGAHPKSRSAYRMSELVADVVALIEQIDCPTRPINLVGHDWGAAIAWAVAMKHPDRIRTLTALSVPHPTAFVKAMPQGQILDSWYMLAFMVPLLPERVFSNHRRAKLALQTKAKMPPEAFATFVRDFAEVPDRMRSCFGFYRALPWSNPRSISRVQVPTTFIWGDQDMALSRVGAELCGNYVAADYRFEVINGASHWLPDERPADVARHIVARLQG